MRSCLILGSGRSGTSMVAGSLADSGYFQGGTLHAPRAANPKGFFETAEINTLNDALLRTLRPNLPGGHGWLVQLSADERVTATSPQHTEMMAALTSQAPFCFKDPRFSYTIPAWSGHLPGDTRIICVFRDPLLTATSIVEEVGRARYLQGARIDLAGALETWAAMYRQALAHRATSSHEWIFVHYDQMLDGSGQARLGTFLDAPVSASFADKTMRRSPPAGALSPAVEALYKELCQLAGYQPLPRTQEQGSSTPDISAIAIIEDGQESGIGRIQASLDSQRGVSCELVVVDNTTDGGVVAPGATVIRCESMSRGTCYLQALAVAKGRHIAWADTRCWRMPNQLARLAEILDGAPAVAMIASDYHVSTNGDSFAGVVDLKGTVDTPPPGWRSGILLRRAALELISEKAFWPVELELLKLLRGVKRVIHIAEPLFSVEATALEAGFPDAARDAAAIGANVEPWDEATLLTVSLCTYNRKAVLRECLTALCRQNIPRGAFKITLVNDGSSDGTQALLDSVSQWPVPVEVIHRENGGLAAARNTGLEQTQTPLVLFINDDTIAAGDLVLKHIQAHHAEPGGAVLGSFPQPPEAMAHNLTAAVENADLMFCYNMLSTEQPNPPQFFYTCNVSVETQKVLDVGGFDETFRHYGAEDTDLGLRLGLGGMRVHYVPEARAIHRHPYTFAYLQRRAKMVARAHIRLWSRHPDQAPGADITADQRAQAPRIAGIEAAAQQLADINLGALRDAGLEELAAANAEQLETMLKALNPCWWQDGLAEGLREHSYASMAHLLARHPFEVPEARRTVWVMIPTSDAEQTWVERAVQFRETFKVNDPVTLVVVAGVEGGYSAEALSEGLQSFSAPETPHIAIIATALPDLHVVRLLAGADGWVPTGSAKDAAWARLAEVAGCPTVEPRLHTAPWPLASDSKTKLLAWPSWSDDNDLRVLLSSYAAALVGEDSVTLCLRIDPEVDDMPTAMSRLQALADEVLPADIGGLDVLVVEDKMTAADLPRLGQAVDSLIALPSNTDADRLGQTLGVPVVHSTAEMHARIHA